MSKTRTQPSARLRIVLAPAMALGPGKADLLQAIEVTGSIAGAGRSLGMSYRRAWTLTEALNSYFAGPLVITKRGGSRRGGASLTELGRDVLSLYRRMEQRTNSVIETELAALQCLRKADR
ncbi:MAG: winged helix-turn-helix domain-containing protein [Geminicoccaceae bacterium]